MVQYCLDTNVFIQAQNGPYAMDIVPAFWDWLVQEVKVGTLFSSILVYEEITAGNDDLAEWAKGKKTTPLFQEPSDEAQAIFADVSDFVLHNYAAEEANFFLAGADPWIIAQAKAQGAKVVTMEKLAGPGSKKVKIPNICMAFDVDWLNTYQLLRELRARFTL